MKLFLHVHTKDRNYKPILLRARDAYDPNEARDPGGKWTGGGGTNTKVPAAPGEAPIPQGMVRRFHYTSQNNIESIKQNGLTTSHSTGTKVGDPVAIWSNPDFPGWEKPVVEFWDDPKNYEANPIARAGNVPPNQIVAIHEPWHQEYRETKAAIEKGTTSLKNLRRPFLVNQPINTETGGMTYGQLADLIESEQNKKSHDAWEESKHPRGHPGNPGQFVSKGQGTATKAAPPQRSEAQYSTSTKSEPSQKSVSLPKNIIKSKIRNSEESSWRFGDVDERYNSVIYDIIAPGGSGTLVLSKESDDWQLSTAKEDIINKGQQSLEEALAKNGLLESSSEPKPSKSKASVKLPPNVKSTAKVKTKATFAEGDHEEAATGYAIDDDVRGRFYLLISEESDSWKTVRPGQILGQHGNGQESLNTALASFRRSAEIPKPESGSQADQAAADLSRTRVQESVKRYRDSNMTDDDKTQAFNDIVHAVFDYMKIGKSVNYEIRDLPDFMVGDKKFSSGGQFNPSNNTVTVCRNNGVELVDRLVAHEAMHAKYDAVMKAYRKEAEYFHSLSSKELSKIMRMDGKIRDEYKDTYPFHSQLPDSWDDVRRLEEEDGITDYSRAYWEAVKSGGERSDPELATNETLAEMAKLDREGSLHRLLWYKQSKTYRPLYQAIHKLYPKAVEVLNT